MDIKLVEKVVAQIQRQLFKNSNTSTTGFLKSKFRGSGLQFKEHRIYNYGDEIRFIDWKLLAKTGEPYVKTFEEDRNVEITVILDSSLSMFMGHNFVAKFQGAIEICCLLYLLSQETRDYVRVILVGPTIIDLPAKSGREGIALLIATLERQGMLLSNGKINTAHRPKQQLGLTEKEKILLKHVKRKKELIILSDFQNFLSRSTLENYLSRPATSGFCFQTPLSDKSTEKFAFFADEVGVSAGNFSRKWFPNSLERPALLMDMNPKIREKIIPLPIHKSYLELFVKAMMQRTAIAIMLLFACANNPVSAKDITITTWEGNVAEELEDGDLAKISFWFNPFSEFNISELNQIEGKIIANRFKVIKVLRKEISANNSAILEVDTLSAIIPEDFSGEKSFTSSEIKYYRLNLAPSTSVKELSPELQLSPVTLEKNQWLKWSAIAAGIFILLGSVLFVYKKYSQRKHHKKLKRKIKHWLTAFQQAQSRPEFERLYAQKNVWSDLPGFQQESFRYFLSVIKSHQYRHQWDANIIRDVQDACKHLPLADIAKEHRLEEI